jgi:formylglycine-generating enzyme required for sulfatase activity
MPANSLAADSSDINGYAGEINTGGSQKRTLMLNNNEVIWDMAGNVWDWTNGTITGGKQPGLIGDSVYTWKQWNDNSLIINGLPLLSSPDHIGLPGIVWNSASGIGKLYSNYGEVDTRGFLRGGAWYNSMSGILTLSCRDVPGIPNPDFGFRVSR